MADNFVATIVGGKLVITSTNFGDETNTTLVFATNGTSQTATSPSLSITDGEGLSWSSPVKDGSLGVDGFNNATARVYQRKTTEPTDAPDNIGSFTFSTGSIRFQTAVDQPFDQTLSNNWYTSIDLATGSDQLWVRSASAVARVDTDSIAVNEWSGVVQSGSTGVDGQDGLSNSVVAYYQRTSTSTAPTGLPTSSASYNFGTGALIPIANNNWQTLSTLSSTGGHLWITTSTASSRTSTDTIATSEWADAILVSEDGIDGSTVTLQRSYTDFPGLLSEIGDPTTPGTGITWTSVVSPFSVPATAFWVADRYIIGATTSAWQISPVQAKDAGLPFVSYSITRSATGIPTLGDSQWVIDAIEAVEAFTGRDYTTQKEFGYGTVVVINYSITGQVNGALSIGATSIVLDSTTQFPATGSVIIGGVTYAYSDNNTTTKTLTVPTTTVVIAENAPVALVPTKLFGKFTRSGSSDTWVTPTDFIDGDLFVDGTIASDKLQANTIQAQKIDITDVITNGINGVTNTTTIDGGKITAGSITATEIAAETITADEIDVTTLSVQDMSLTGELVVDSSSGSFAFGKTGPNDFDTPGVWMGNEGGNAYFLAGSSSGRYILFDGANGILFITGETLTGPAVVGASTSYTEATGDIRHDLPVSITSIKIEVAGAGGGGGGYSDSIGGSAIPFTAGGAGGSTVVRHYNVSDVLQGTYTGGGGSSGSGQNGLPRYSNGPTCTVAPASGDGIGFTAQGSFAGGTGGQGINIICVDIDNQANPFYIQRLSSAPMPGTGIGSGGGGGMKHRQQAGDEYDSTYAGGGGAGSYSIQASLSVSGGDYLIVSVGGGGDGGGTGIGTSVTPSTNINQKIQGFGAPDGDGSDGAARIEYLTTT